MTHDLLLSKKGIALPAKHGLNATVSRHKARLSAELTKTRLRRGFATLDLLRAHVNQAAHSHEQDGSPQYAHPRWIRINTLRTTLEEQLRTTFAELERVDSVKGVSNRISKALYVDEHIPNLIAVSPTLNFTASKPYREGKLIFQDKASCFPAYLLNPSREDGTLIDACAAPGNKTTHLAALLRAQRESEGEARVIACEKDAFRSKTLAKMTKLADPEGIIQVKAEQNFLKLVPTSREFEGVTGLVLDPSCSGSGIVGRDEGGVVVHLPSSTATPDAPTGKNSRKRKRNEKVAPAPPPASKASKNDSSNSNDDDAENIAEEEEPDSTPTDSLELAKRLIALSDFQLRLLLHAMTFPSARKITYSTCSIHGEENEGVVVRALLSETAREAGWRVMRRSEQVDGMRRWGVRGEVGSVRAGLKNAGGEGGQGIDEGEVAEACLRCDKRTEDGTMGFFVAGFVREEGFVDQQEPLASRDGVEANGDEEEGGEDEDEWGGFSDDE